MILSSRIENILKGILSKHPDLKQDYTECEKKVLSELSNAISNDIYQFESPKHKTINQGSKRRIIKQYENPLSSEYIASQIIKEILDRRFKIKYPNRNKITKELFSILPAIIQMSEFTIVKFDFKDFFNSLSSIYVFEKYIKQKIIDREELALTKRFIYSTKNAYAGLCTSNSIAEIAAKNFDKAVINAFFTFGILYYERYIDDSILILNQNVDEVHVRNNLNLALQSAFHDKIPKKNKCKTKFNDTKFKFISKKYITDNTSVSFDFLGYEFHISHHERKNKLKIQFGITEEKIKKYNQRLDSIINHCRDQKSSLDINQELLRHCLRAFSSRVVYVTKQSKKNVWNVKGFISNYGELSSFLNSELIEPRTKIFLENMINDALNRQKIKTPTFIEKSKRYNLFENMKLNRTLLLVEHIGYDYNALTKICDQIGITNLNQNGKKKTFGSLVKEYLVKVCVGF